jgi:hypothetical protein
MERSTRLITIPFLVASLLAAHGAWAAVSISLSGSWFELVDETDLAGPAGSDLISIYESAADQVQIQILTDIGEDWRVDVRRVDTDWHGDLDLFVRRTSEGSGPGSISGGDSYQELSTSYQEFFSGTDDRSGVNIQIKLEGVSASTGSGNYLTTIYYTIVEVR